MTKKSQVIKNNRFEKWGLILFIIFFILIFGFLSFNIQYITDSDQSSNLIYAKEIIANRTLLPTNWYFSTYVDLLNVDKIQALLFLLIDNWMVVHVIANIITEVLLLTIFYLICKELKIKNIPWLLFVVLGGFSLEYYKYGLSFNIYSLYMTLSFVCFYMIIRCFKYDNYYNLILLFLSVFFVATSGIRNIVSTFVPAIASIIVMIFLEKIKFYKKNRNYSDKYLKVCLNIGTGMILGYLFYSKVMCPMVGYESTPISLTRELINNFVSIFKDVITKGWFELFGFLVLDIFLPLCLVLVVIVILWSAEIINKRNDDYFFEKFTIIFFVVSSCAISATFFVSTSFRLETRYLMQSFGYYILLLGLALSNSKKINKKIMYVLISICVILRTLSFAIDEVKNSDNKDILDIKQELYSANVKQGYAGLWDGNILTELSNGDIEVWVFEDEEKLLDLMSTELSSDKYIDNNHLMKWLQKKEHFLTRPEEPFFFIISSKYEGVFNKETVAKHLVYKGDKLILMIFDSYEDFSVMFYNIPYEHRLDK